MNPMIIYSSDYSRHWNITRKIKSKETNVDIDFYYIHQSILPIIANNNVTILIKVAMMLHFSSNLFALFLFKDGFDKHLCFVAASGEEETNYFGLFSFRLVSQC